jgi:Holliday junction DNA helicase RuvA
MYAFIRGILRGSGSSHVILEAGGVGYHLLVPASVSESLPPEGEEALLYTALVVRESEQTLYGFSSVAEKELFQTVTAVSGIGPKLGLALLGHLSLGDLQSAIGTSDIRTLSKVPGIGKRTAERLIVELRDRLPALFPRDLSGSEKGGSETARLLQDALSALQNLGYTQAMAQKALAECREEAASGMVLSELIASALQKI